MKKIGLLKQSFNPISLQDVDYAKEQLEINKLDEIWFIVLENFDEVNLSNRQEMILIALKNEEKLKLSSFSLINENNNEYFLLKNENSFKVNNDIFSGNFKLIDKNVKDYILSKHCYLKEIVKNNLSEYRYKHSVSVAKLALKLARAHNYDENKAYIAGILHDVCKEKPYKETMKIMNEHFKELLNEPYPLYHAFTSMIFTRDNLLINDEEILKAIFFHTLGTDYNVLSKIIYIADKLDPLRDYDCADLLNLSLNDLDKGFDAVKEETNKYWEKNK